MNQAKLEAEGLGFGCRNCGISVLSSLAPAGTLLCTTCDELAEGRRLAALGPAGRLAEAKQQDKATRKRRRPPGFLSARSFRGLSA